MTQDSDIVIDPNQVRTGLDDFILSLHHSDFLFDEMTVRTGVADGQQFQLLDEVEVLKLDIYPRELIAGELSRSEQLEVFAGQWLPVVSRADATLSKLIWISKGSHKSRRDLRAIYRNTNSVQRKEILAMATDLELADLLREVLNESDELE